jgi:hypothetical protein
MGFGVHEVCRRYRPTQVWFAWVKLHRNNWTNPGFNHPRFNSAATSEQYYSDRGIIWKNWF